MKDLGVIVDSELKFKDHIYTIINRAYKMLGIIKCNFPNMEKSTFMILYKSFVRSCLETSTSVWNPHSKGLIFDLEKVQKRATKLVGECKCLSYADRLKYLKLPSLVHRRLREDMIEAFKILHNSCDNSCAPLLQLHEGYSTRGNSLKLGLSRSRIDIGKYAFSKRIVNIWNTLPDSVVTADSVNSFKNKLDAYWKECDLLYDYNATYPGLLYNY